MADLSVAAVQAVKVTEDITPSIPTALGDTLVAIVEDDYEDGND